MCELFSSQELAWFTSVVLKLIGNIENLKAAGLKAHRLRKHRRRGEKKSPNLQSQFP